MALRSFCLLLESKSTSRPGRQQPPLSAGKFLRCGRISFSHAIQRINMGDRFQYAEVRQKLINALRTDLMGPQSPDEVLDENPMFAYIVGMLYPQTTASADGIDVGEQEVDTDIAYEDGENYTSGEDDDNEPIAATKFKQQSSIGISFYVKTSTSAISLDISWGDYIKTTEKKTNKDGKEVEVAAYKRLKKGETLHISFSDINRIKDYPLICDSNVVVHVSKIALKHGFFLVTAYVINRRPGTESVLESILTLTGNPLRFTVLTQTACSINTSKTE